MTRKTIPTLEEFMAMVADHAKAHRGCFTGSSKDAQESRQSADQLRGWIEKAYAGLLASANGGAWLPIETAPKDDAILVAGSKRMGVCVGRNDSRDGWETETPSEWVTIYQPTYWMPLPPPPASKS